jgi:hypothetical protein
MTRFTHFAAVDWSGASGLRHAGIAVALIAANATTPELIRPGHRWARAEVLDWLIHKAPPQTLIGFDLGQSLPFADAGAYFPGWADSPPDARALWAMVESLCGHEPDLGATSFADHPDTAPHFRRHGGRTGAAFVPGRGRMRVAEQAQAAMGCAPTSNFNLVGAAQVGKSSLSGMRLFHRLPRDIAVWPIDPLPPSGKVAVEIYTTIAAMTAGRSPRASKIRDADALGHALHALGCAAPRLHTPITDHMADALVTAAWARANAMRPALWSPPGLDEKIAQTEGWTFGAV